MFIKDLINKAAKALEITTEGYNVLNGGNDRINNMVDKGLLQGGIYTNIKTVPVSNMVIQVSDNEINKYCENKQVMVS